MALPISSASGQAVPAANTDVGGMADQGWRPWARSVGPERGALALQSFPSSAVRWGPLSECVGEAVIAVGVAPNSGAGVSDGRGPAHYRAVLAIVCTSLPVVRLMLPTRSGRAAGRLRVREAC